MSLSPPRTMAYTHYYEHSGLLHSSTIGLMGTRWDSLLFGQDKETLQDCAQEIQDKVRKLHHMLNRFDPQSEISRITQEAKKGPCPLSEELNTLLAQSLSHSPLTEGIFDISLGQYQNIEHDSRNRTLHLHQPHIQLDLGGYGKGLALQQAQDILHQYHITQALLNFGDSSILALGSHPHGDHWPLALAKPQDPSKSLATLQLRDQAASISGRRQGQKAHIYNPLSKQWDTSQRLCAVIAQDPLIAEILSTTFILATAEQGERIRQNYPPTQSHIYE